MEETAVEQTAPAAARCARHLIGGSWRASAREGVTYAPATAEPLGRFADGGEPEAHDAIAAARRAFEQTAWPHDRSLRARALGELSDLLTARRQQFVELLARENGKVLADATLEVDGAIPKLRYHAALALTDAGRAAEVAPGLHGFTLREPAGVAGVIVPWNSPVILAIRSLAPALAAGCTVVAKMPAQTALVNELLAQLFAEAPSLPAGVVNLFTESGDEGAKALVASPAVDVVSYTGSSAVGRRIMAAAAPTLKGLSLELGGKTPTIVFDDADLDAVVPAVVASVTTFAGQFCMAGSRVLAHRAIARELRERLAERLARVRLGPGDDPASEMGPLIDRAAVDRVEGIVEAALAVGGRAIVRGGRAATGPLVDGAFVRPALIEVEDVRAAIVQEEVFGPVATFEVFDDERDAIERANATPYGLAAGVWTRDVDRPLRVGRGLRVGTVWTNAWGVVVDQFEEGGMKQSGIGRLNGMRGLEEFLETKTFLHVVTDTGVRR